MYVCRVVLFLLQLCTGVSIRRPDFPNANSLFFLLWPACWRVPVSGSFYLFADVFLTVPCFVSSSGCRRYGGPGQSAGAGSEQVQGSLIYYSSLRRYANVAGTARRLFFRVAASSVPWGARLPGLNCRDNQPGCLSGETGEHIPQVRKPKPLFAIDKPQKTHRLALRRKRGRTKGSCFLVRILLLPKEDGTRGKHDQRSEPNSTTPRYERNDIYRRGTGTRQPFFDSLFPRQAWAWAAKERTLGSFKRHSNQMRQAGNR